MDTAELFPPQYIYQYQKNIPYEYQKKSKISFSPKETLFCVKNNSEFQSPFKYCKSEQWIQQSSFPPLYIYQYQRNTELERSFNLNERNMQIAPCCCYKHYEYSIYTCTVWVRRKRNFVYLRKHAHTMHIYSLLQILHLKIRSSSPSLSFNPVFIPLLLWMGQDFLYIQ